MASKRPCEWTHLLNCKGNNLISKRGLKNEVQDFKITFSREFNQHDSYLSGLWKNIDESTPKKRYNSFGDYFDKPSKQRTVFMAVGFSHQILSREKFLLSQDSAVQNLSTNGHLRVDS